MDFIEWVQQKTNEDMAPQVGNTTPQQPGIMSRFSQVSDPNAMVKTRMDMLLKLVGQQTALPFPKRVKMLLGIVNGLFPNPQEAKNAVRYAAQNSMQNMRTDNKPAGLAGPTTTPQQAFGQGGMGGAG
jgi:hypothetical protein